VPLAGERHRIYCSGRDELGRSDIGFVDVDLLDARARVSAVAEAPLLASGRLGAFDDSGATMSCVVRSGELLFLYYTGWSLGATVPFYLGIGLAVSEDQGKSFQRVHEAPIVDRDQHDPYLVASPWVLVESRRWRMWYISATEWRMVDNRPRHYYNIRYAESGDGIAWRREGHVCVDFQGAEEHAFGRPCVLPTSDGYEMWFPVRGTRYRIGHARSPDGLSWTRDGEPIGLAPSETGWDSQMMAYPSVIEHAGRRLLLYNGNDYGRTGFGWAEELPGGDEVDP
jgi:hypothetical protein